MTAEQARDRLAALLPGSVVVGYATRVEVSLRRFDPDQAAALADEIEAGRAAVAALARVKALLAKWRETRAGLPHEPSGRYVGQGFSLCESDLRDALRPDIPPSTAVAAAESDAAVEEALAEIEALCDNHDVRKHAAYGLPAGAIWTRTLRAAIAAARERTRGAP